MGLVQWNGERSLAPRKQEVLRRGGSVLYCSDLVREKEERKRRESVVVRGERVF